MAEAEETAARSRRKTLLKVPPGSKYVSWQARPLATNRTMIAAKLSGAKGCKEHCSCSSVGVGHGGRGMAERIEVVEEVAIKVAE